MHAWTQGGRLRAGRPVAVYRAAAFERAWAPRPGRYVRPPEPIAPPCYDPATAGDFVFFEPFSAHPAEYIFRCGLWAPVGPPSGAVIVVPIRRFYMVINNIGLRTVGGVELAAYSFSMDLDAESWTWSFSATLRKDSLPYVQPVAAEPVELEATINGVAYRLLVGKIGRDESFGHTRIRISGRGKAAILAAPYAPVMSFGANAERTAQQLMADVLTINGAPIGWAIDWGLTDWPVPAGAWSFQGTYMDAINDIAQAAGGYVQPHPTAEMLRILPRYPAAPWTWGGVTPDIELPADVASVETTEWVEKPAYNRVFVGGVGAGVFGPVTRAGTAGELVAPQVAHPLITHADAHRQRGTTVLSDAGRQVHVSLKLQALAETGLILPGKFIRYMGKDAARVGIVRKLSLEWSSPVMRQTIGVETHVA